MKNTDKNTTAILCEVGDLIMEKNTNTTNSPLVSICIPVFNEEKDIERTITNVLTQTYDNFEVVISDNASTDQTGKICKELAEKDSRVKYFRSSETCNQNENFNRVFKFSKGQFTLWLGGHDWLDEHYIKQCIAKFEENPEYVLVTTYKKHIDDDGAEHYEEYKGTRLDSKSPYKRFSRMLWFLTQSYLYIGPVCSMMRRSALEKTSIIKNILFGDRIISLEMSLLGPWGHVPKCLHYRKNPTFTTSKQYIKNYGLEQSPFLCKVRMCLEVTKIVWRKDFLKFHEKLFCTLALIRYYFRYHFTRTISKFENTFKIGNYSD